MSRRIGVVDDVSSQYTLSGEDTQRAFTSQSVGDGATYYELYDLASRLTAEHLLRTLISRDSEWKQVFLARWTQREKWCRCS